MERRDIEHCAVWTAPVAAVLASLLWPLMGGAWALCLLASAVWAAANLWALGLLLEAIVMRRPLVQGFLALQVKLGILLGGGAALMLSPLFTPVAFLVGFHVVFAVIAAQAIRRVAAARMARGEAV
ncbi:hypothetical protein JXA47_04180 [Candidatus Sumerlaeota bacterium]|nr:hypothetical protein [Candidatus Sumerlaeota bacterium]